MLLNLFWARFTLLLKRSRYSGTKLYTLFLDASSHLHKSVCPSVRPSVRLYVCNAFVIRTKLWQKALIYLKPATLEYQLKILSNRGQKCIFQAMKNVLLVMDFTPWCSIRMTNQSLPLSHIDTFKGGLLLGKGAYWQVHSIILFFNDFFSITKQLIHELQIHKALGEFHFQADRKVEKCKIIWISFLSVWIQS